MRIISGNFKGKKILKPKDKSTRPLKDLTKESLFNILLHSNKLNINLKASNILDLFSGVGSFGLECLSREASFVTFVENYKKVLPILEKNILNFDCTEKTKIIEKDILEILDFNIFNKKFNIIFIDPPYKEKILSKLLKKIFQSKILNGNGIIVIHRHKNEKEEFGDFFKILEEKNYGISKLIFGKFN